jgi:hypothetical protein
MRHVQNPVRNPFKHEPAIETLLEVLTHNQEQKTMANQDRAIHLRWALRDIKGKRMKSPVSPDDLRTLIEMGLVEMRNDSPVLTNAGHAAID